MSAKDYLIKRFPDGSWDFDSDKLQAQLTPGSLVVLMEEYATQKINLSLGGVSKCKKYDRNQVVEIIRNVLKATGGEIKAEMINIHTKPRIMFEGKDLAKWIESNV